MVHLGVMIANGLSTTMTRTLAATRIDRLPGLTDDEPFAMSTRPGLVPTGHLCVASTVQLLLRTWTGHLPGVLGRSHARQTLGDREEFGLQDAWRQVSGRKLTVWATPRSSPGATVLVTG